MGRLSEERLAAGSEAVSSKLLDTPTSQGAQKVLR